MCSWVVSSRLMSIELGMFQHRSRIENRLWVVVCVCAWLVRLTYSIMGIGQLAFSNSFMYSLVQHSLCKLTLFFYFCCVLSQQVPPIFTLSLDSSTSFGNGTIRYGLHSPSKPEEKKKHGSKLILLFANWTPLVRPICDIYASASIKIKFGIINGSAYKIWFQIISVFFHSVLIKVFFFMRIAIDTPLTYEC